MSPVSSANVAPFLWLLAAVLAVGGLALLWFGIWPRRRGVEPRCRGCDYNLTGNVSERCPECGRTLGPHAIVHGTRRKRPWRIGIGVLLLLLAGGTTVPNFVQIDWYAHLPAGWVLSELDSPATFDRAWTELQRRYNAGALADRHMRKLVAVALAEQRLPPGMKVRDNVIGFLGDCYGAGLLTESEVDQFLRQSLALQMEVRARNVSGDEVPYRVSYEPRMPDRGIWAEYSSDEMAVDSGTWRSGRVSTHDAGVGGGGSLGGWLPPPAVGKHHMQKKITVRVYRGPRPRRYDAPIDESILLLETTRWLGAPFEVLAEEPADLVRGVPERQRQAELESLFTIQRVSCRGAECYVDVHADPLPVNVAFDAFVRNGERETYVGSFAAVADTIGSGHGWSAHDETPGFCTEPPMTCAVILRSSARAAKRTVDVFEFWEGELVFEDIQVQVSKAHVGTAD